MGANLRERRAFEPPAQLWRSRCRCCGEDSFEPFVEENGFAIVRCRVCELVMVNPLPDQAYLDEFYGQYHEPGSADAWGGCMRTTFAKAADALAARHPSGRLLDVGCGFGEFLRLCEARGLSTAGIEPGEEPSRHARETTAAEIHQGTLASVSLPEASFDAVTLWFVLEHVLDPLDTLRRCRHLLRPGGTVMLVVPNMEFRRFLVWFRGLRRLDKLLLRSPIRVGTVHFFHAIDPPGHLYGFNRSSLGRVLGNAGFVDSRFSIPPDLRHASLPSRLVERGLNVSARLLYLVSWGRTLLSNGLLAESRTP